MTIKELLLQCQKEGTAVLATNFYNFETLTAVMKADGKGEVSVRLDSRDGKEIARFAAADGEVSAPVTGGLIGKHAVYFVFDMEEGTAELDRFTFDG